MLNLMKKKTAFSPPYGDGTFEGSKFRNADEFSPPYGDGTALSMAAIVC